jgi:sialidase-1
MSRSMRFSSRHPGSSGSALRRLSAAVALSFAVAGLFLDAPIAAGTPAAPIAAATAHCSSTPFRSKPSQHQWYRIPAIVKTGTGALVAFAERRDNNDTTDLGNFDIVSARSTDHGCSWSSPTVIGNDAANRVSNPVPILDASTGDVLLFSVVTVRSGSGGAGKGLYLQTSTDDGKTFSALLDHPVKPDGGYKGGLTGPGHGIQLRVTHPGRLILPMGYKTSSGGYGAYGIYSDDHGTTWHTGFDQPATGWVKFIEGTIAELPSGNLFISFRDLHDGAKAGTARYYAQSTDGGAGLSAPFKKLPLKIVSVEGSSLALTGAHSNELLFSAPADPTPNLRRDLTVFVSRTNGTSWSKKYQVELESTPGAYSDLVQIDDSSIGVLYETGTVTWKERIAYESISVTALTDPIRVASTLTYQRSKHPTSPSARAKIMVTVKVKGITSPPGRVTLKYVGHGRTRTTAIALTYSNQGVRAIFLPKLAKGNYTLTLTYAGTGRIKQAVRAAGVLQVTS